jgi:hypothetical protein
MVDRVGLGPPGKTCRDALQPLPAMRASRPEHDDKPL